MKELPFTSDALNLIVENYKTPFYLYDERQIREQARLLNSAFSWNQDYKNFFAVKATPNPAILSILKNEGMGFDCSSLTELLLMKKVGVGGNDIMFSSNNTSAEEFKLARSLGATINLDDITHIEFLEKHAGLPELLSFRCNFGELPGSNSIIGDPKQAKFGMTPQQVLESIRVSKSKGVKRFGLHTMMVSSNLDTHVAIKIVEQLFELAAQVLKEVGVKFEFINLGGGIGIPYKPTQKAFDVEGFGHNVMQLYEGFPYKPAVFTEYGRFITGQAGYLITRAIHNKNTYKSYVGVDASMHNLMRPGMYGAYHHITVVGKNTKSQKAYDVVGSLCENNDKFAIDRKLPDVVAGDILVIHDVGSHGHAMGFNYNGKLRSAELLKTTSGRVVEIRRAETPEDYFATLTI